MNSIHFHFNGDVNINLSLPDGADRPGYKKLVDSLEEYLHDAAEEAAATEAEADSIVMVMRPDKTPEVMQETQCWEEIESRGKYDCLEVVSDDALDVAGLAIVFDGRRVLNLGRERYLLGPVIVYKYDEDAKWREERQADKETAAALRDASVIQITKDPGKFARYLELQGDNPSYSSGNIALAMAQLPEATVLHTRGHWKDLGRFVLDPELKNGASIFTRSATGRGYNLTSVYDIAQTQGRELRTVQLKEDTEPMEAALTALLNFSPVQVVAGENLPSGAYYDPRQMTLAIDTACPDGQAFAAIAAEIAQARFHDRGRNPVYSRESCELSAQSVSYILCRRFGVQRELPDLTKMAERCQGGEIEDRLAFLKEIQGMSRQIGGSIEKTIAPPQRAAPSRREAER